MPIYEYECTKCGRTVEVMQSMSDPPLKKCETCGGKLEKKISAAGFILKGGGWYKDLYSSSKPESKAEGGGESKAETKTESGSGSGSGSETEKKKTKKAKE